MPADCQMQLIAGSTTRNCYEGHAAMRRGILRDANALIRGVGRRAQPLVSRMASMCNPKDWNRGQKPGCLGGGQPVGMQQRRWGMGCRGKRAPPRGVVISQLSIRCCLCLLAWPWVKVRDKQDASGITRGVHQPKAFCWCLRCISHALCSSFRCQPNPVNDAPRAL